MSLEQTNQFRQFEFSGNAKEWFGIWIVNLLLSIVTVGVYSAWAKVRTKKYFYNNTSVEGRNFDYHATGGQILKGRLIVIAALVVFQITITVLPIAGLILVFALLVGYPWLLTRAMMFNARQSSFSNVRFNFVGTYGRAAMVYLVYPILCLLTLYTTAPILDRTIKRFSINNHKLGLAGFDMDAPISAFYKAAGLALLWIVVVFVAAIFFFGFSFGALANLDALVEDDPSVFIAMMAAFYAVFFAGIIPAGFIYHALTRNAIYNGTTVEGGHKLRSNIGAGKLLWIALSNMVVVVCTLGLMLPWAQVRMTQYLADHTGVELGGSLDDFIGTQHEATTALGDAYSDIEGIDVGLPI
ncbi:MAG: YjgN family protein [Planktotalea arctica]